MSQYGGMTLTAAGLALETKAQTGVAIHFTRVSLGEGTLAAGQLLSALTDLISRKLDLPIIVCDVTGTGTAQLQAVLQNKNLVTGFFAREIGVYATDPDAGEILYAVANAGTMADYIPAGGGADVVELILSVITVVGQASTVTAEINTSLLFATVQALNDHKSAANPHPQFLQLGPAVTTCNSIIVQQSDPKTINPMSVDDAKKLILGGNGSDITNMRSQIDQIGREQANMALAMEAQQIYPDYNALLAEDFTNPDLVDQFSCAITSIVAGDDSIDVETLRGIVPGAWYTISDGVYQETCQVRSAVKNGSTYRLIMQSAIVNTYVSGQTYLYRSTAEIQTSAGQAEGAGDRRTALWQPATTWTGTSANTTTTIPLVTTAETANQLTIIGNAAFTADGYLTLA
ncbi:phage tail protein [uncultured Anaeromusa sp.]|uniref:phage tail-collar fiber domain-containing protein n=1 Tax=uncultured Anaeromusa sp. TaxID=673273 RepID=UPI0029C810C0|nr:phage tail protein [uncultured Anaeromusa sp.]